MKDTYYSKTSFGLMGPLAVLYSLISNGFLRRIRFNYFQEQQFPLCAIKDDNRIERLAIVTGSNTGIGFETARQLVHSGYTVILACRSRDKGEAAAARINHSGKIHRKDHPAASALFVHPLDLSDFSSVRAFCKVVEGRRIHLLVNNAGINTTGRSADQLDLLFQSNFLGHFLLTSLLLPQLCGRIINLSSVMHHFCRSRVDGELNRAEFWKETAVTSSDNTYSLSKLAALLFTVALNERYPARRSIAVNPGAVNSDIWRAFPRFVIPIFSLIYLTNEQGCQTTIAAALQELPKDAVYLQPYWLPKSTKVPFPTMEMLGPFVQSRVTQPRLPGPDEGRTAAAALWEASAEITGASWPAPIK